MDLYRTPRGKPQVDDKRLSMTFLVSVVMLVSIWAAPSFAVECESCIPCHGNLEDIHGDFNHSAALVSDRVVLFSNSGHDEEGRSGESPYFAPLIDCNICHNNNLPAAHGNDCATCHPTPYDTLGLWNKGCQQGGCHAFYHQDSIVSHLPWNNTGDAGNECSLCHFNGDQGPTEANCLNCHDEYKLNSSSLPLTTAKNVLLENYGPVKIDFTIKKSGKVAVGRTFYQLDDGAVTASGKNLTVSAPGDHELSYWSKDQNGNTESTPNFVSFSIYEDTTPPTTTSNVQPSYNNDAYITLTASDNSTLGVKNTYYRLNGGPTIKGNSIHIPVMNEEFTYTLTFWSEDWAGNLELQKSVTFTVKGATGIIRLVWADSEFDPYSRPNSDDWASWSVRKGSSSGDLVATGYGGGTNWDGVDDIRVPVSSTPYYVRIDWYYEPEDWRSKTIFSNVSVISSGQIVRLHY